MKMGDQLTNQEYLNLHKNSNGTFSLDDTDELGDLVGKVAVMPKVFGYSETEGLAIFPPYYYPR